MIDVLIATSLNTLGTKIIVNQLRKNNISVRESIITENTLELLANLKPRILDINWVYDEVTYDFIMDILPEIKRMFPNIKIIFGGYTSTYDWQHLKDFELCDAIIGGESDDSVVACCKDLLSGKQIDKLKYLKTPLPDLSKYDYENNILETENDLTFETARSCVNALHNRCWYCTQFKNPYRPLDLKKTIDALQRRINKAGKKKNLIIVTPETLPQTINELWNTFHTSMWCYVIPQHFKYISDEVEGCEFYTGYDIYEDPRLKHNPTKQFIPDIVRVAKKNSVCFGSVILGDRVPESTRQEIEKVKQLSKNIRVEYNSFVPYPGVNGKPLEEDIYKRKTKINTYKPIEPDDINQEITVNGVSDYNYDNLVNILSKYKIPKESHKRFDFLDSLEIQIICAYLIEGINSILIYGRDLPKLQKFCLTQRVNAEKDIYKCIFTKDLEQKIR